MGKTNLPGVDNDRIDNLTFCVGLAIEMAHIRLPGLTGHRRSWRVTQLETPLFIPLQAPTFEQSFFIVIGAYGRHMQQ